MSKEFFFDVGYKIIVVIGVIFLLLALPLFTQAFQWESLSSLFIGGALIIVSILIQFKSSELKFRSREGVGTILICASILCMISAVVAAFFAVPGKIIKVPTILHDHIKLFYYLLMLARPDAWLAPILVYGGLGLLALGFLLRFVLD
jgi:hypothetical protein